MRNVVILAVAAGLVLPTAAYAKPANESRQQARIEARVDARADARQDRRDDRRVGLPAHAKGQPIPPVVQARCCSANSAVRRSASEGVQCRYSSV